MRASGASGSCESRKSNLHHGETTRARPANSRGRHRHEPTTDERAERNAKRMSSMLKELAETSQLESGGIALQRAVS
jgi:hypothetical protein